MNTNRCSLFRDATLSTLGLDWNEGRHFTVSVADSLTDPELAGPVQLLKSGKFDIPIEQLTGVNVPAGTPENDHAATLQGCGEHAVRSEARVVHHPRCRRSSEAERLGVNFSKKLHNAGDAARTATRRAMGRSCSIPVL